MTFQNFPGGTENQRAAQREWLYKYCDILLLLVAKDYGSGDFNNL